MSRIILMLFTLLISCNVACADDILQHITFDNQPPGSFKIKYGGLYSTVYDGASSYLEDFSRDFQLNLYNNNYIDLFEYSRRQRIISNEIADLRSGGKWWSRTWWESFPESRGGAPETPAVYYVGNTYRVLDIGLLYINSDMSLNTIELETSLDFNDVGNNKNFSGNGWLIRLKPQVSFSSSSVFSEPQYILRRISARLKLIRQIKNISILSLTSSVSYSIKDNASEALILLEFLMW